MILLWLGTFGYCILSGLVPFVNAEAYLIGAVALSPASYALPIVIAGTLGQMVAKVAMYLAGRGVVFLPGERVKKWIETAHKQYASRDKLSGGLVFLSASSGFPPFYIVSIACGALKTPLSQFIVLGTLGRFLRFGALVLIPYFLK